MVSKLFDTALSIDNGSFVTSALLTMSFANGVSLTTSGDVSANRSDGTFIGWYPSWASEMLLSYYQPQWDLSGSLRYTGQDIDLNEVQGQHAVTASLAAGVRPSDHLSFSVFAIQLSGFAAYFNTAYRQADANGATGNLAWQTKLSAVISY